MPFDTACSTSSSLINRELSAISVIPSIKALIPFPDPPPEMEIFTSGFSFM